MRDLTPRPPKAPLDARAVFGGEAVHASNIVQLCACIISKHAPQCKH